MTTLVLDSDPAAVSVAFEDDRFHVDLADGRALTIPLSWYPRLEHAREVERANWRLLGGGYAIEWPDLDEHIGVEGLVAGRRSGESQASFKSWLESRV